MTREYWESVAENVNSFANSGYDEHCLKILSLSYNHLPIHLKPCLLYMSLFPEDAEIKVSRLIKLWVAEGFLKPIRGKTLEEAAQEYLRDLIDRNLILIRTLAYDEKIKTCSIHDLLRDLCLRESKKDWFYCAAKVQEVDLVYDGKHYNCFLCKNQQNTSTVNLPQVHVSQPTMPVSCFVCDVCRYMYPQLNRLRLIRITDARPLEEFLQPTKLRYFSLESWCLEEVRIFSSMFLLWNLQNFIVETHGNRTIVLPSEIWEMPQLRRLVVDNAVLPDPRVTQTTVTLENLHTLRTIFNFRFSEDVLERIPNIRKLRVHYNDSNEGMVMSDYCLQNLPHLNKLESLYVRCESLIIKNVAFPHLLKKLVLRGCKIPWEDMTIIGLLQNLEVLELISRAFVGPEWNPVEGEFLQLKTLLISDSDLVMWGAESFHFPNLENLTLESMLDLEKIPSGIGEIVTLRSIFLVYCAESVVDSATTILEKQRSEGYEGLQLDVIDD